MFCQNNPSNSILLLRYFEIFDKMLNGSDDVPDYLLFPNNKKLLKAWRDSRKKEKEENKSIVALLGESLIFAEMMGFLGIFGSLGIGIDFAKKQSKELKNYFNFVAYRDAMSVSRSLKECFDKEIVGQESAKSKIAEILLGYLENLGDKTNKGSCCITLLGSPYSGKSLFVNSISKALTGSPLQDWQVIDGSNIKTIAYTNVVHKKSSADFELVARGMVKVYNKKEMDYENEVISPADQIFHENSDLIRNLKRNSERIVFIKRIDKIHKFDPKDTILERLRDARDTGILRVRKSDGSAENIDVSKTIFLLTSCEEPYCWGVGNKENCKECDDRTEIERDMSLVKRFFVVELGPFSREDFEAFMKIGLEKIKASYMILHDINISFSDDLLSKILDSCENMTLKKIEMKLMQLRDDLLNFRTYNDITDEPGREVLNLSVDYDNKNDKFLVSKM